MGKLTKSSKLLRIICSRAKNPTEKPAKAILTLESTQDEDGSHLYCPELDIFVSASNCREMFIKFLSAMFEYFYSLKQLPEDYVGEVEKIHLALFEEQIIPNMAETIARETQERLSIRNEIKRILFVSLSRVSESLNISRSSKCERELLCLHSLSRLAKLSRR